MHGQPIKCASAANSAVPPSLRLWLRRPSTGHDAAGHDAAGHDAEEWGKTMTNPTPEDFPPHYERPEPGRWTLDAIHSFVSFSVLHMNISYARGVAAGPTGTITIAPNLLDSSVEATIDASTLTTLDPLRDAKMRGSELLDVDRYGTIDFASTGLWPSGEHFLETSPCGAP